MAAGIRSGDRFVDYATLAARASQAAAGFAALGVEEGGAVALMLRNDFALFETNMAAGLLGAYAVPINWHFTAEEAGYVLRDSGAKALVIHADLLPRVADGVPPGVRVLAVETPAEIAAAYGVSDAAARVPAGVERWDDFVAANGPLAAPPKVARGSMIYTSGTTGKPKGVRRQPPKPEQLLKQMESLKLGFGLEADPTIRALMNGPMYHSAPAAYGMGAARVQLDIVLQPRFEAEDMLRLIEAHRITHMHIVPTMFVRLLRLPDEVKNRYDLSSLRFVVHGAAPCPPEVKRRMIEWWGPVINEYYGATETGLAVFHTAEEALRKPGTVGRAMPGVSVKVFDESGAELKQGEIGEIYLKVETFPEFTYNNADEKRREVGRGDYVTVGDVGYVDPDGYIFLCDRKRDMVITGGVNVYPAEIESVLIQMPGVRDCAVFGIPDEEFGEAICAVVQPDGSTPVAADDVRAFLAPRLARYKLPKAVEFREEMPREDSGKIFKRKLREPYWAKAGRAI